MKRPRFRRGTRVVLIDGCGTVHRVVDVYLGSHGPRHPKVWRVVAENARGGTMDAPERDFVRAFRASARLRKRV